MQRVCWSLDDGDEDDRQRKERDHRRDQDCAWRHMQGRSSEPGDIPDNKSS